MRGVVLAERYRLDELLGAGGFAEVYRAHDQQQGTTVAVKVLCGTDDAGLRARFRQEALLLAEFEHPHIVRALDYAVDDGGPPYMVLEYVPGPTLRRLLQERAWTSAAAERPLFALATVLGVARVLLDTLGYLHARGVVHRDLKPENVILAPHGLKLLDFGLARPTRGAATTATTRFLALGTPPYMAPEQAFGLEVDGRADLFSLGVMLYELLTGEWPYAAETLLAVASGDSRLAALPEPAAQPQLPEALVPLLWRLLRLPPGQRYPNVAAVSADLESLWLALPAAERERAAAALAQAGAPVAGDQPAAAGQPSPAAPPSAAKRAGRARQTPPSAAAALPLPSILAALPAGVLRLLAGRLVEQEYAPNAVVLQQGELGEALHLVVRGRFAVERQRPDGREQRLATLGPGDLFGELALIDGAPRSATVRALTAGATRMLARVDFLAVLREHPDVAQAVMTHLVRTIRRLDQQLTEGAPAAPPGRRRTARRRASV